MSPSPEPTTVRQEVPLPIRGLQDRFEAALDSLVAAGGLESSAALLLGCSAGGDSMALLELAARRARVTGAKLDVAHFDHAQRPESAEEAAFVGRRCKALGIGFLSERWQEAGEGPAASPADEGSLREARLGWFVRAMETRGSKALLLAHQADDRAETTLMRLLRGSGPTGLASIRPMERLRGMLVLRPLLEFRRDELRHYLQAVGVEWREDPSNEDERFDRVWVRRRLMPLMNGRMGTDVTPRLVRTSQLVDEESRALAAACELVLGRLEEPAPPPALAALRLDDELWGGAPPELRRALLRQWLWKLREGVHPPGFETVREAVNFAQRGAPGLRHRTVERIHLVRESGRLVAYPPEGGSGSAGS